MPGAYSINAHATNYTGTSPSAVTVGNKISVSKEMVLYSLGMLFTGTETVTIAARLYSESGTLLASGSGRSVTVGAGSYYVTLPFTVPYKLVPGQNYYVAIYVAGATNYLGGYDGASSPHTHESTPVGGWTLTWTGGANRNGDGNPGGGATYTTLEWGIQLNFDPVYARRGYNAPIVGRGRRGAFMP